MTDDGDLHAAMTMRLIDENESLRELRRELCEMMIDLYRDAGYAGHSEFDSEWRHRCSELGVDVRPYAERHEPRRDAQLEGQTDIYGELGERYEH